MSKIQRLVMPAEPSLKCAECRDLERACDKPANETKGNTVENLANVLREEAKIQLQDCKYWRDDCKDMNCYAAGNYQGEIDAWNRVLKIIDAVEQGGVWDD